MATLASTPPAPAHWGRRAAPKSRTPTRRGSSETPEGIGCSGSSPQEAQPEAFLERSEQTVVAAAQGVGALALGVVRDDHGGDLVGAAGIALVHSHNDGAVKLVNHELARMGAR